MSKRYKYYAPSDTDSQWQFLKMIDRKIVKIVEDHGNGCVTISQFNYEYPIFKVSMGDLQEIETPTQSNVFEKCFSDTQAMFNIGWKKATENERKKHEPKRKINADELVREMLMSITHTIENRTVDSVKLDDLAVLVNRAMSAALKNRGYDE